MAESVSAFQGKNSVVGQLQLFAFEIRSDSGLSSAARAKIFGESFSVRNYLILLRNVLPFSAAVHVTGSATFIARALPERSSTASLQSEGRF